MLSRNDNNDNLDEITFKFKVLTSGDSRVNDEEGAGQMNQSEFVLKKKLPSY